MATMMTTHKDMREQIENNTWEQIDEIKEKNKAQLSEIIE